MLLGTGAQSRELEERTAALQGIESYVLMERAGAGAANVAREMAPDVRAPIVVVSGKGNNGGDGFVVARLLAREGRKVTVYATSRLEEFRGDAAKALAKLPEDLRPRMIADDSSPGGLGADLEGAG